MNDRDVRTTWNGEIIKASIPHSRDPFINTSLLALGKGKDGEERFWISSWNDISGSLGVLVSEFGKERIYRFGPPNIGFYSAIQEDEDTLWLCGDLSRVVKLSLSTGKTESYETGAPSALVFQGMVLDPVAGKLFATAYLPTTMFAFSFDYRNCKPVKVYEDVCKEHYMRSSFPNGDGTYSCVVHNPEVTLLHWDPRLETIEAITLKRSETDIPLKPKSPVDGISRLINNEDGRWYFPNLGWYNPATHLVDPMGLQPQIFATWFARRGNRAWGTSDHNGNAMLHLWDMTSGQVTDLCVIPDAYFGSMTLTSDEKIIAVNLYGEFFRFDGRTGTLEASKRLSTNSVAYVDCLCRIDEERLLGTPFISQRFWEINLTTGAGYDCGRAAPGSGEILQTWNMGGKIYMAAYTGGELTEYNPAEHSHFPENPRVVADPPGGMRPVAAAQDDRYIYYSCSHFYGNLGCVLTKYDTESGMAVYMDDPIPEQMIRSLCFDKETNSLFAGTTMHADCHSCPPVSDQCFFVQIDAQSLSITAQYAAPQGTELATVHGAAGQGKYLCSITGNFDDGNEDRWFIFSIEGNSTIPALRNMNKFPEGWRTIAYAGKPGLFILQIQDQFELWDMTAQQCVQILYKDPEVYNCHVQDHTVYLVRRKEIIVLENCLAPYGSTQ